MRNVRELAPESARMLDQIIAVTDVLPHSGKPINVNKHYLSSARRTAEPEIREPDLDEIVTELERRAANYQFGDLQTIRAEIKGRRLPKPRFGRKVFGQTHRVPQGDYVLHYGGRSELQFNIGFESEGRLMRHGVAFSFEPSRSLPWPELGTSLLPKAKLFNEFMDLNAELFRDMRMWHDEDNTRIGGDELPGPIPWERIKKGVLVFLGNRQPIDHIDYDVALSDLDRLLPLYKYVESNGATEPTSVPSQVPFRFCPTPWVDKVSSTVATQVQMQLDVVLRHNAMQKILYERLAAKYGIENIAYENVSGVGTRVDVIVRRDQEYWFYEIKTAQSPRACLREAIGQLLEYAFWPGAPRVTRLIIVGETTIDGDGAEYLRYLKNQFSLPLEYEAISI
jgi:hypothetical protein